MVDLREDYMRQFDQDEGWATLDCFRVNAQYTDKNFLDDAQRLELTGRLSKLGYGEPTSFARDAEPVLPPRARAGQHRELEAELLRSARRCGEPTLFGTHWVPSYSVYTERRGEYQAYLRTTVPRRRGVGDARSACGCRSASATRSEYGRTHGAAGGALRASSTGATGRVRQTCRSDCDSPIASASLQRRRTDNPVEPTRGYIVAGELRGSASGDRIRSVAVSSSRGRSDGAWYHTLHSRIVFAGRLRGGIISGGRARSPRRSCRRRRSASMPAARPAFAAFSRMSSDRSSTS